MAFLGYRVGDLARDLALVWAVPLVLVIVYVFVPTPVQTRFAFDHGALNPITLVTAAYVHVDDAHLYGNLGGYLPTTLFAYLLCLHAGERRWFRRTFVVFLFVLPVLVNLVSYAILAVRFPTTDPVSRGFSGVAAGFAGFLFVALLVVMRTAYSRLAVAYTGQLICLGLLVEVYVIYAGKIDPGVVAFAGLGAVAAGAGLWSSGRRLREDRANWRALGADAGVITMVALFLGVVVYQLFPADVVTDGSFTNVFAHASGVVFGTLLATGTFVVGRFDV